MALRVGSQPLPQTTAISQAAVPAAQAAPAAPKGLEAPMKLLDQNIAQLKANYGATGGKDAFSGAPEVSPTLSAPQLSGPVQIDAPVLPANPSFLNGVGGGGGPVHVYLHSAGGGSKTGISGGAGGLM